MSKDSGSKPLFTLPDLSVPRPTFPKIPPIGKTIFQENMEANYASQFHSRLIKWINSFDASLDNEHEVGVRLVSFGQSVTFHLRDIGFWNPSLISFSGELDSGDPVELIQHVSQISILLMKMRRKDPESPKRPIGFNTEKPEGD